MQKPLVTRRSPGGGGRRCNHAGVHIEGGTWGRDPRETPCEGEDWRADLQLRTASNGQRDRPRRHAAPGSQPPESQDNMAVVEAARPLALCRGRPSRGMRGAPHPRAVSPLHAGSRGKQAIQAAGAGISGEAAARVTGSCPWCGRRRDVTPSDWAFSGRPSLGPEGMGLVCGAGDWVDPHGVSGSPEAKRPRAGGHAVWVGKWGGAEWLTGAGEAG